MQQLTIIFFTTDIYEQQLDGLLCNVFIDGTGRRNSTDFDYALSFPPALP